MNALAGLFSLLIIPFMLLNLFGGIVAGIWLAILGEWKTLFLGLIITFVSKWLISLFLIPSLAVSAAGMAALSRGHKFLGWCLLLFQSPWTYVVILFWELAIFKLFGERANTDNWVPVWLWSYGAATGIWAYMASQESRVDPESNAGLTAAGAQIAYLVLSVCVIHFQISPSEAAPYILIPLLMPLGFGLLVLRLRLKHG